jgi:hypothetical protein
MAAPLGRGLAAFQERIDSAAEIGTKDKRRRRSRGHEVRDGRRHDKQHHRGAQ